jgi:hypothetical protein
VQRNVVSDEDASATAFWFDYKAGPFERLCLVIEPEH